jgi:putative oxidoreductase
MSHFAHVPRVLLGLVFVVFGANYFLKFFAMPGPAEGTPAAMFVGAIYGSGMLTLIKVLEIAGGVLLLSGRFVPLALMWIGPIAVVIFLFHAFLAPEGLPVGAFVVALLAATVFTQRAAFAPLLAARGGGRTAVGANA